MDHSRFETYLRIGGCLCSRRTALATSLLAMAWLVDWEINIQNSYR